MAEFKDDWVTEAMTNETIVANFLVSFSGGGSCEEPSHQTNLIDTSGSNKVGEQSEIATTPLVSGEAVLEPHQIVEAHSDASKLVSPQTIQDNVLDEESPDFAATASPKQQDTSNQEPQFFLPDLNLPAEDEDFSCNVIPSELS